VIIGHHKQREFLGAKYKQNQLAHAYLFTGQEGIGKKLFAVEFAKMAGCKFPDLKIVTKKVDKSEIDISQIREVQNFLSYKSYNGGLKIVIVDNAEEMNVEAQSCFLKTLEEPKGDTLIILVSSKPDMLLSTIFSRCQTVKFFKPKDLPKNSEKVKRDKEILDGLLPVLNSTLADKFKYAKAVDFENQELSEILGVMQRHYRDVLLADYENKKVINILNLIEDISNKSFFTNINQKLALEILLMEL
jgi:DNA polymerase-3 subunit delta'